MLKATELLNRFFEILVVPELSKPDRIKSEWIYLLSLLKGENIELERIEAYLNIIEKTEAKKKTEDGLRQTPNTTVNVPKPQRNVVEKEKEFGVFGQSTCINKENVRNMEDTTPIATQMLSIISNLNKMFQANGKIIEQPSFQSRMKGEQLTPKMIRNNFKKNQYYDNSAKGPVETKRYSSSFKNRY